MDGARFPDRRFGSPAREPGNPQGFTYYLPAPIPRRVEVTDTIVVALSDADTALGHLQGVGAFIRDPGILIGPYLRREALASSRIEGTQASLSDVFRAEIDEDSQDDDTDEVQRYLEATTLAYRLAATLPISQRLVLSVHETLMRGVRGEEKSPGRFRTSPVWVGPAGATPHSAPFVPPLPVHLPDLLRDWEVFVNDDGTALPALLQAALMHYQFETIHPFLDGNGRIGRLLINLLLTQRHRLPLPLLYLSHYFETHRDEYYARLQAVRETGDLDAWLVFFLRAVQYQATDAIARSRRLIEIREQYHRVAVQARSNLPRLIDIIVQNPFVTVRSAQRQLDITYQGARNLIKAAEQNGWLRSLGTHGRGGREHWVAYAVLDVMEAPMAYDG